MQSSERSSVCLQEFCFWGFAATPKRENNTACSLIALSLLSAFLCLPYRWNCRVTYCCFIRQYAAEAERKGRKKKREREWNERRKHFVSWIWLLSIAGMCQHPPLRQQDEIQRQIWILIYLFTEWATGPLNKMILQKYNTSTFTYKSMLISLLSVSIQTVPSIWIRCISTLL